MAEASTGTEVTTHTTSKMSCDTISRVPPVHSEEEIYRYVDLGLGRGLDGTDPTPWLNKSSFQVRRVTYENILGTEEGGAVQSYEREISSVHTQQTKIKSSIVVPKSPMTIGTDAELSRSVHTSRRAIGRKVINRTISFRDNFDDLPFGDQALHDDETSKMTTGGTINYQNLWTFEQRLADWIVEKLKHNWHHSTSQGLEDDTQSIPLTLPSDKESSSEDTCRKCPLRDLLFVIEQDRTDDLKLIAKACDEFVTHFRITHYVSAIELGATEYRVLTEDEYQMAVSLAGTFGIEKLANLVIRQDYSSKRKRRASDLKRIGIITKDERVDRGSYGEAVVNVSIKSITTLVKSSFLHNVMERALVTFVESQSDRSDGPFLISCGTSSGLYLEVDPNTHQVNATTDINAASEFHIIPADGVVKANEFYIGYYEEKTSTVASRERRYSVLSDRSPGLTVPLYLDAPLSICGTNNGPLYVWDTVADKTSRFVLHSRIVVDKGILPVPLSSWTSGSDMFYINCSRRRHRRGAYVAIRRILAGRNNPNERYITTCISRISYHDNTNIFMLFQLLPVYLRENKVTEDDITGLKTKPSETAEGIELQATNL